MADNKKNKPERIKLIGPKNQEFVFGKNGYQALKNKLLHKNYNDYKKYFHKLDVKNQKQDETWYEEAKTEKQQKQIWKKEYESANKKSKQEAHAVKKLNKVTNKFHKSKWPTYTKQVFSWIIFLYAINIFLILFLIGLNAGICTEIIFITHSTKDLTALTNYNFNMNPVIAMGVISAIGYLALLISKDALNTYLNDLDLLKEKQKDWTHFFYLYFGACLIILPVTCAVSCYYDYLSILVTHYGMTGYYLPNMIQVSPFYSFKNLNLGGIIYFSIVLVLSMFILIFMLIKEHKFKIADLIKNTKVANLEKA